MAVARGLVLIVSWLAVFALGVLCVLWTPWVLAGLPVCLLGLAWSTRPVRRRVPAEARVVDRELY